MIHDLLVTLVYTSCVEGAVPISAVLVADSGTAKSKVLKQVNGNDGIHLTDSFSSQGLFQLMQADPTNKIRFIVMPDLNPTLSRQQKTVTATVANLLTLTMDGTCRIDDGRQEKLLQHKPIGLLSGVTPDIFKTQSKRWFSLGLTRRIIPLFYEYTSETERKLLDIVSEGKITSSDFPPLKIELNGSHAPHIAHGESKVIEGLGIQFGVNLGMAKSKDSSGTVKWFVRKIVPVSPVVILRTLAQANAIRYGRGRVSDADITFLTRFLGFTNPAQPRQI